jgi:hypothetical protein
VTASTNLEELRAARQAAEDAVIAAKEIVS